jgi:hypothetical protein
VWRKKSLVVAISGWCVRRQLVVFLLRYYSVTLSAVMTEKENSALRLYRFIQKMVPQQPPTLPLAQVLLNAFDVPKEMEQRDQNAILARIVVLLFGELDSIVGDLRKAGHSEESLQPIVRPFNSFSGTGLATRWQNYKEEFAASLPVLLLVGETLPEDGTVISHGELSELGAAVRNLGDEVRNYAVPDEVKKFIFDQLDIISRAIREYPLAGAKAFRTAVRDAIFHTGEHSDIVAEYQDAPIMGSLRQIQEKAVKYAKYAVEVSKFVGALDSLYHHLQSAPGTVRQLAGLVQHVVK